jgi:hypothetical protein
MIFNSNREEIMKKAFIVVLAFVAVVFMFLYGCKKNSSPSSPSGPVNTATNTPVATSTAVGSPNLSGSITVPAGASGKHFVVVVDTDQNTANGYVSRFVGIVNSTTMPYAFLVTAGNYYVYAYIDMNDSGLTGPGGLDYFGANAGQVTTPNTAVNFSCTTLLDMLVTMNVTVPSAIPGVQLFAGFFNAKDISIMQTGPIASTNNWYCPSGTAFTVTFTVAAAKAGTYYLLAFANVSNSCGGSGCLPTQGDFVGIYGGSPNSWPASANVSVNGDVTVNFPMQTVTDNVSGTVNLPGPAGGNQYLIYVSTMPMGPSSAPIITKTASAGAGSSFNYSFYSIFQTNYYITAIVDMDSSGWNNSGSGQVSAGDYVGAYGVTPPILNWLDPFPPAPNASVPGSGKNITCVMFPSLTPAPTPTLVPAPTPGGSTGTVSGTINVPAGQAGKDMKVVIDMDFSPDNPNTLAQITLTVTDNSAHTYDYTFTGIPTGTYYVYTACMNHNSPLLPGDALGVYGSTYPSFPASRNVTVNNGAITTANITMVVATANVTGRMYLPGNAAGKTYYVVIDSDTNGGNNGQVGMAYGIVPTSNPYVDYSMVLPLPGNWYIYGGVDMDGSGGAPNCGDYFGFYSYPDPVYMTPAGNNSNMNFNARSGDMLLCP